MKAKFRFLFPFVLVFLLWEWAAAEGIWSSYILPSPGRVGETLCHMIQKGELVRHILISLRRIVTGFFWAFLSSCLLSSLNLLFPRIRDCYAGLLEVFRHVPPLSLIPLLILWFGIGELPKTIISREYSSEWKPGDEPYYPVNDEKNGELYARYKERAQGEKKVIFGGRLGEYKYYDMDAVIASALECAKRELR